MRIAHITATFPPYEAGTGRVAYFNALELSKLGHEVVVFTAQSADQSTGSNENLPFVVNRMRPLFQYGNAPFIPNLVIKLLDFDIVHLHYPYIFGAEITRIGRQFRNIPFVLTHHNDLIIDNWRRFLFQPYSWFAKHFVVRAAEKWIVVSEDHARNCNLTSIFETRWADVKPLSNGVDINLFNPKINGETLRRELQIDDNETVITFVGALDSAHLFKRVKLLLRTFASLECNDLVLLIVGDGDMKAQHSQLADALGISRKTRFAGRIPHNDLPPYYAASDIVVLPSSPPESFGMVLIEAAACAKPVIASNIPGVRSVVDDGVTGLLFEDGNEHDLGDKLSLMIENPKLRQTFGKAGFERVVNNYSWSSIGKKLERIYQEIVYQ